MNTLCGAPDLPFLETVGWYFKQMLAGLIVVGTIFTFIFIGYVLLTWKKK